jgi:hypothetical protein
MRPCLRCKKYFYFDGQIQRDANDKLIERGKGQEPKCTLCEKYDADDKTVWEVFSPKNQFIFDIFLMCRAFNCLPQPGGVFDQNPWLMEIFLVLSQLFEKGLDVKDKLFQMQIAQSSVGSKL